MAEHEVRIIKMPACRLALVNTVSSSPEMESIQKLMKWVEKRNLADREYGPRWFGRNNPPPQDDKAEYGYDAMVTIPDDITNADEVQLYQIPERTCAVVKANLQNITQMWNYLYDWVKESDYEIADHGLEELLDPYANDEEFLFDLWLPVRK
ncbi:MAG TPA: AraC family transcriptional regulator [candidate division Zixibacteria bacterium]|nr:AraC family transcriptional regulator [candidate division Zixibacteria bacterium]HER00270.1 AraC family transcriptional regulator [candidate division Zixibacteria bacterium]